MRALHALSAVLLTSYCIAQVGLTRYWDNWFLGFDVSRKFNGTALPIADPFTLPSNQSEGTIVCDPVTGERLFSIHSTGLLDRYAQPMPRSGELLFAGVVAILPHPGNTSVFYLIHMVGTISGATLSYSTVDLGLNDGLGDLTGASLVPLLNNITGGEVAAISSPEGNKHWLVTHEFDNNNVVMFECNAVDGLITTPMIQSIGPVITSTQWNPMHISVSATNTRLAFSYSWQSKVCLFDVDPMSGLLSNPMPLDWDPIGLLSDLELSPDGNVLYLAPSFNTSHQLVQFDLSSWDSLAVINSAYDVWNTDVNGNEVYTMRTGPDGRLYMVSGQGAWYLFNWWHLNHPDSLGAACDPDTTGAFMGNTMPAVFTLPWTFWPSMPHVGIAEEDLRPDAMHAWLIHPSTAMVQMDASVHGAAHLQVLATNGQVVRDVPWPKGSQRMAIDLTDTGPAVYVARVLGADGRTIGAARFAKAE